jgi:hypothetical protein
VRRRRNRPLQIGFLLRRTPLAISKIAGGGSQIQQKERLMPPVTRPPEYESPASGKRNQNHSWKAASQAASTRRHLNLSHIRLRSEKARCEAEEKPPLADWFSPPPNAFSDFEDRRRRMKESLRIPLMPQSRRAPPAVGRGQNRKFNRRSG